MKSVVAADTAVIYMGAGEAAEIATTLIAHGMMRDTPVAIVENASLPEARRVIISLAELGQAAAAGLNGPAVIMLGRVFAFKQHVRLENDAPQAAAA